MSGKTDVLLHGHILEDGRQPKESNKHKKAEEKNVMIIDEDGFSEKLRDVTGKTLNQWLGIQMDKVLEEKNDYRQSFVPNVLG